MKKIQVKLKDGKFVLTDLGKQKQEEYRKAKVEALWKEIYKYI